MRKIFPIIMIALAIVVLPNIIKAEEGATTEQPPQTQPAVPPQGQNPQNRPEQLKPGQKPPLTNMPVIRDELRKKIEDAKANQDVRNKLLPNPVKGAIKENRDEMRKTESTTHEDIRDIRQDARKEMRAASSTEDRKEVANQARLDVFKAKQDRLIKELTLAIENIKQIRNRVSSRIDKAASEGRNMTEPKKLLVGVDQKISVAQDAVKTLSTMTPPPPKNPTTTPDMVNVEKPRQLGEDAIKKVKVAREALNAVVVSIAKHMGLGPKDKPATTTPAINTPAETAPVVSPASSPTTTQ
jgi:hypothetical protein